MEKEKKEIGIEKLIELLNEYENTDNWENRYQVEFRESKIISKKFGFIKWLVENDKIDLDHLEYKYQDVMYELLESLIIENKSDFLIMLLSIQEQPIRFLCEILK